MKIIKLAFVLLLVTSCTQRDNKMIPTIDLQNPRKARVINLSELLDQIHIIRLETSDSTLLGPDTSYLISDKFVISIDQDKILQFSLTGAFIRTLARAGNGPEEFLRPEAYVLDVKNDILFINHRGDPHNIISYDLKNGQPINKFPTNVDNLISQILITQDSILTIVPRLNSKYNFYYLSSHGDIIDGVAPPKAKNIGLQTSIELVDSQLFYMPKEYDTLYSVYKTTINPYCFFFIENRFSYTNNEIGNFVYLSSIAPGFMIANKAHARIKLNPDGETFSMNADKQTRFFVSKKDFSVSEIIDFYNDFWGFKENTDQWINYLNISNNFGYICYSSFELKQKIKEAFQMNKLNDQIKKRISELDTQISENDNPVLIIGSLK